MDTPFRFHLRPAPDSHGERSVDDIVTQLLSADPVPVDDGLTLARHPDERVPLLLLRIRPWQGGDMARIRAEIGRRAIESADDEGLVWTPVLDGVPYSGPVLGGAPISHGEPHPGYRKIREVMLDLNERAARLVPWIREQEEPSALDPLYCAAAHRVRSLTAANARVASDEQLVMFADGVLSAHVAENQALLGRYGTQLLDMLSQRILVGNRLGEAERKLIEPILAHEAFEPSVDNLRTSLDCFFEEEASWERTHVCKGLLARDDLPVEVMAELLRAGPHVVSIREAAVHPAFARELWGKVEDWGHDLADILRLSRTNAPDPGLFQYIWETHGEDAGVQGALLRDPGAPLPILRAILAGRPGVDLVAKALDNSRVKETPELYRKALSMAGVETLTDLSEYSRQVPDFAFDVFLEALIKKGRKSIAERLFMRASRKKEANLPLDLIRTFMQSSDRRVRTAAITVLGEMERGAGSPKAAKTRQSR